VAQVKTYRDLIVWQKSMVLVMEIYRLTKAFPRDEMYGLTSQIRRAAVSIPSNICEGYARNSDADFARFLRIACGSLYEMQTQLEIAGNLQYLPDKQLQNVSGQALEVEKMLSSLINKITNSSGVNHE
jgi:four helix bundle protein